MAVTIRRKRIRSTYNKNSNHIKVKRKYGLRDLIGPVTAGVTAQGALSFKMSDVVADIRYDTMYDKYRISGIKLKFYPTVSLLTSEINDPGFFYYYVDHDDRVPPSSTLLSDFMNIKGCKQRRLVGKPFSLFFRPNAMGAGYDASTPSPSQYLKSTTWFDMAYNNVEYFGFKWMWISDNLLNQDMPYEVTYYLEFKNLITQLG